MKAIIENIKRQVGFFEPNEYVALTISEASQILQAHEKMREALERIRDGHGFRPEVIARETLKDIDNER